MQSKEFLSSYEIEDALNKLNKLLQQSTQQNEYSSKNFKIKDNQQEDLDYKSNINKLAGEISNLMVQSNQNLAQQHHLSEIQYQQDLQNQKLMKQSAKSQEFNQRYYDQIQRKKENDMIRKSQKHLEELKQCKSIPKIDHNSRKIVESGSYQYVKLEERTELILREKKRKLEEKRIELEKMKSQQEAQPTFHPIINKSKQFGQRNFNQFIEDQQKWQKKVEDKNQQLIVANTLKPNNWFQPNINKNTDKILSQNLIDNDFFERQKYYKNKQNEKANKTIIEEESKLPFTPLINEKSKKLALGKLNLSNISNINFSNNHNNYQLQQQQFVNFTDQFDENQNIEGDNLNLNDYEVQSNSFKKFLENKKRSLTPEISQLSKQTASISPIRNKNQNTQKIQNNIQYSPFNSSRQQQNDKTKMQTNIFSLSNNQNSFKNQNNPQFIQTKYINSQIEQLNEVELLPQHSGILNLLQKKIR